MYLLDTFEGFNYKDSENSSDVKWYKSHFIDEEEKTRVFLKETLKDFSNYKLVTNNICKDDLPEEIKSISLAHIDVDMYEATLEAIIKVSKILWLKNTNIHVMEKSVYLVNALIRTCQI